MIVRVSGSLADPGFRSCCGALDIFALSVKVFVDDPTIAVTILTLRQTQIFPILGGSFRGLNDAKNRVVSNGTARAMNSLWKVIFDTVDTVVLYDVQPKL